MVGAGFLSLRRSRVVPLLIGATLGAAIFLIHAHSLSASAIRQFIGENIRIEGVVTSDPQLSGARVIGSRLLPPRASFKMRAERVQFGGASQSLRIPIRVMTSSEVDLLPGERILLSGHLMATREADVAALLAAAELSKLESPDSIRSFLDRIRSELRDLAQQIGGDSGSLLPGLAIGDTKLQSPDFALKMRSAGLSHLTAVSGANFAIVSAFIFAITALFLPRIQVRVAITSIFLFLFILLVRPTPSVLRAATMAAIFLISKAIGAKREGASALAIAVAVLLLINPFQAFEPGFILSVLATGGLIFVAPVLQEWFARYLYSWLAELLAISISATLVCTPYLMLFAGKVSAATILANILVSPVVPIITVLVFIAALLVLAIPQISLLLLKLGNVGASWIVVIANWSQGAPEISVSPVIALALIAILIANFWRRSSAVLLGLALVLLITLIPSVLFLKSDWQVAQCDVGQGDALLINLGSHQAALFDAGPNPELLDRCLRRFHINSLPLIVISHRHADHLNGISGIRNREVGEVWVNGDDEAFQQFQNVRVIRTGAVAQVGELRLATLWPEGSGADFAAIPGDGSLENNESLVILAEIKGVQILITGDIEPGVQEALTRKYDLSPVDILKVPHHGSKYQFAAFIEELAPALSLISVGDNSYGHPNPETITALEAAGSNVYRTDKEGSVVINWRQFENGAIFSAKRAGKEWWQISWR